MKSQSLEEFLAAIEDIFEEHDLRRDLGEDGFVAFDRAVDECSLSVRRDARRYVVAEGLDTFLDPVLAGVPVADVVA